jgi:hypothetical protein
MAAMLLLVATVPPATAEPAPIVQEIEQPTETGALPLVPILIALVAGGVIGAGAAYVILDDGNEGGTGSPDEAGRQLEASIVTEMLSINGEILAHNLNGYVDIWRFTNSYWMRQAEVAAAERWGAGQQYSAQALVERAGLYHNTAQLLRNINEGPDATFSQLNDRVNIWKSVDGFGSMKFQLQHGSSSTPYANGLDLQVRPTVTATAQDNKVYLTGDSLWSMGTGKAIAEDGTEIPLVQGYNAMSGLVPGVYQLSPGDYAGGILPALMSDAAKVRAGMVITSPDGAKLAVRDGDSIRFNGNSYPSFRLAIDTGSKVSDPVDLMPLLRHYDNMIGAVEQSLTKAASAAYAAWMVYTAAGESNILLSPSSLVPQLEDVDVSAEQMAVLTTLYLRQVHDYYQRVQGNLNATGWSLSPDSIDLYMRGDIYDSTGTRLYESVVMTPYIWLEDWTISKGLATARQSGILALWGETADLNAWTGAESGTGAQIVALEPGYQLDVKQIMHHGQPVESVALTIMEIQPWDPIVMPKPHDLPDLYNVAALVQVIGLLIGGLIAMLGFATRQYWLLLVGGIVAAVIAIWPDLLMGLL